MAKYWVYKDGEKKLVSRNQMENLVEQGWSETSTTVDSGNVDVKPIKKVKNKAKDQMKNDDPKLYETLQGNSLLNEADE
jgi:hypothetical protein